MIYQKYLRLRLYQGGELTPGCLCAALFHKGHGLLNLLLSVLSPLSYCKLFISLNKYSTYLHLKFLVTLNLLLFSIKCLVNNNIIVVAIG